jgi:hypothetical protein
MKKLVAASIFTIAVVIAFGYFTRYEYFKVKRGDAEYVFRTNRYTNETDVLGNGWVVVQTPQQWADLHRNKIHPVELPPPIPANQ